ncbi:MAG: protein translocase subunit SecF [Clostridia bacterium]|nr:protein translocase subunit SecF [Clostridia bacterium]
MIDLIGKKYYFFALSVLIFIAGIAGYVYHGGFNLDIQFQGGTIIEMKMKDGNFDAAKAEEIVMKEINKKATAQKSSTYNVSEGNKKIDLLVLSIGSKDTLNSADITKVQAAIEKEYNLDAGNSVMSVESVEPFIGKEIRENGLKATLVASLLIILYIWFRFKVMSGLSAGIMAVLGLLHDVAVMLAVYTIFYIPLNESFIAAALTIMGYSMNDTIIIYDRIRENSSLLRKLPIAELVNKSILQTLTRSINTVVTVLISIATVYVFAVINNINSIEEFSLPLLVGIASGCYSSIFIASPLWVLWKESQARKKIAAKPVKTI